MRKVATIGVYGFTAEAFLDALAAADVRQLLDLRRRRGVRGREYAWANAARLEASLAQRGIEYRHRKELSMPDELRKLQYREDARGGVGQRSRATLAPEVRARYAAEVLDVLDLREIVEQMPSDGVCALLCVESEPDACHRSLVVERMANRYGVSVSHIRP